MLKLPVVQELSFNKVTFVKTLNRRAGQAHREGVRVFLRTILKAPFPVETGMAKAALRPLGQYLHNVGGLQVAPVRKPYFHKLEGVYASVDTGEAASNYEFIDDRNNQGFLFFSFEFDPGVKHFWDSEYYSKPGNWAIPGDERIPGAVKAYQERVRYSLRKFPITIGLKFSG